MSLAEAQPVVDTSPFDLGRAAAKAVLCLHGLTGTPYEMRSVGEALSGAGLRALGPVLPGHDLSAKELATHVHDDWLDAARAHLGALRRDHEHVCVVGLSLGGLLTLMMASEERVDAAAVIGTPLRLPLAARAVVPVLKHLRPLMPKRNGSDIRDEAARLRHPSHDVMPLASVHELMRLQRRVRARLHQVTSPLLVAHGAHDRTASPADAEEILSGVGSQVRESLLLSDSGHVVTVDHDAPELAAAIVRFFQTHGG